MINILNSVNYDSDDDIWKHLLHKINTFDIEKIENMQLLTVLITAPKIKTIENGSDFVSKVVKYFLENTNKFNHHILPILVMAVEKTNLLDINNIYNLIVKINGKFTEVNTQTKFEFYKWLLEWCYKYNNLLSVLNENDKLLSNIKLPSEDLVNDYYIYNKNLEITSNVEQQNKLKKEFMDKFTKVFGIIFKSNANTDYRNIELVNQIKSNINI